MEVASTQPTVALITATLLSVSMLKGRLLEHLWIGLNRISLTDYAFETRG